MFPKQCAALYVCCMLEMVNKIKKNKDYLKLSFKADNILNDYPFPTDNKSAAYDFQTILAKT